MISGGLDQRGGKKRRDAARHEKRRKAMFFVNQDGGSRSRPRKRLARKEALELFEAISRNHSAAFGIVKLSELQLNERFDDAVKEYPPMSLLEYSVRRNRDSITRALVTAGSNPIEALCGLNQSDNDNSECATLSRAVRKHLASLPPALSTYRVKLFVNGVMQFRDSANRSSCELCQSNTSGFTLVRVSPCDHVLCTHCFWNCGVFPYSAVKDAICPMNCCTHSYLALPGESELEVGVDIDVKVDHAAMKVMQHLKGKSDLNSADLLSGRELAAASRANWALLPSSIADLKARKINNNHKSKFRDPNKAPFKALPARGLAGLMLGNIQTQRNTVLYRASSQGYDLRVLRVFSAGCDIDSTDEYGNSALTYAIWYKNYATAELLLRLGARVDIRNHAGDSALDVARAVGCTSNHLLQLLSEHSLPQELPCTSMGINLEPLSLNQGYSEVTSCYASSSNGADDEQSGVRAGGRVIELVPPLHSRLEAKGSYVLDDCFDEAFLESLIDLFEGRLSRYVKRGLPSNDKDHSASHGGVWTDSEGKEADPPTGIKASRISNKEANRACSNRVYFSDLTGHHALRAVEAVLAAYLPSLRPGLGPECEGDNDLTSNERKIESAKQVPENRMKVKVLRLCEQDPSTPYDQDTSLLANYAFLHTSSAFLSESAAAGTIWTDSNKGNNNNFNDGDDDGDDDSDDSDNDDSDEIDDQRNTGKSLSTLPLVPPPAYPSMLLSGLRFLQYSENGSYAPPHTDLSKTGPAYRYCSPPHGQGEVLEFLQSCTSTHTFILYLSDCPEGGATRLLKSIPARDKIATESTAAATTAEGGGGVRDERYNVKEARPRQGKSARQQQKRRARIREQKEKELQLSSAFTRDSPGMDPNVIVSVQPRRGRLLLFPHAAPHEGMPVVIPDKGEASRHSKLLLRGEAL